MADAHQNIKPVQVSGTVWFYPTKRGLEFTAEYREFGTPLRAKLFTVPYGKIRRYVSKPLKSRRT